MFGRSSNRRTFPGGLRAQLLLGLLALVIAAFGLIAVLTLQVVKRTVESSEVEVTELSAERLATHLSSEEFNARDIEEAYVGRDAVVYAGRWSGDELEGSTAHADEIVAKLEPKLRDGGTRRVVLDGEPHILATASTDEATAVIVRSLVPARKRISQTRDMLLVYLGIDALFILIIGYGFFTFLVVRPIRAIGVATQRAAKGDLASPISLLPPNEFGRVGRSFNEMLEELRHKREELEERLEELNRTNEELSQAQDSLIRSEKLASVGQLSAGVAHEIGNPLAAIAGYVEILQDGGLDEDTERDILERTGREVERIREIIRDLLDFSREDREQAVGGVTLSECIDEARNLVEAQPRSRDASIDIEIPDDEIRVRAIESQLVQVLVNLLINAVDAVDDGGSVELTTEIRDAHAIISICDDGPGIEPDKIQRLFEPFYTTKDPGKGTGLGLAISLRIIKRFGGDIDVESKLGEGTCFRVNIPTMNGDA